MDIVVMLPPAAAKDNCNCWQRWQMIKAVSDVNPFGNNDMIHRGGSSLEGGVATTMTTNNNAAASELLPSDEDKAMPSYSRRRPVDDKHYCRRNHHGSQKMRNYATPQSEFDDLEDEFEMLDDKESCDVGRQQHRRLPEADR